MISIENIKDKLKIKYYNSICKTLQKNNNTQDFDWFVKHFNNETESTLAPEPAQTLVEENVQVAVPVVTQEDNFDDMYKRPWNKLNIIHKILKMKQYVKSLNIKNEDESKELIDQLIVLLKNKNLTKKDKIEYDEKNGKIISVKDLQMKEGKFVISFTD